MARIKVLLPQFGMGMQDAEIIRWLKQVGDPIAADEPLVELEAAKTTIELPSPATGTLSEILYAEGDTVDVRAHIATIDA